MVLLMSFPWRSFLRQCGDDKENITPFRRRRWSGGGEVTAYEAFICDCDGVIVDSEVVAERALLAALSSFASRDDLAVILRESFGQSTAAVLERIGHRFGITLSESFRATLYNDTEALIAATSQPIAHVKEALEAIDLPMALVSNSQQASVLNSIRRAGLQHRFAGKIFTAEQVGAPKPAPDVYLRAVAAMNVPASRCLALEDSAAGVQSAVAAGVPVIGFVGASHIPPSHADHLLRLGAIAIVDRMPDLPPLVQSLTLRGAH
jgi:HAD superfamily hydrolase (TIGR01509 family)